MKTTLELKFDPHRMHALDLILKFAANRRCSPAARASTAPRRRAAADRGRRGRRRARSRAPAIH
eukprot:2904462-Prymnesium_polylepis.1